MTDQDIEAPVPTETVSPREYEETVIEEVLSADLPDLQPLVTRHLESLTDAHRGSEVETFLHAFWQFAEGFRTAIEGDAAAAQAGFVSAIEGFEAVGLKDPLHVSRALVTFMGAALEVQKRNFASAKSMFQEAEDYLKEAGRFETKFRPIIDHMQPDHLVMGGLNALMIGDHATADALVSQAAEASRSLAKKYYDKTEEGYTLFMGRGDLNDAFIDFMKTSRRAATLDLSGLPTREELVANATMAHERLSQVSPGNVAVARLAEMADCIADYMSAELSVMQFLKDCLGSTFKPNLATFNEVRATAQRARTKAARIGEMGVPIMRNCEQLNRKIDNLQRLAKPTKSDYGIYSGLISCVLFVPLLIIGAWTNQNFELGLEGNGFFITVVALALIGGFGFGALRFKDFIFGAKGKKTS